MGGRDSWNKSMVQEEAEKMQGEQPVNLHGGGRREDENWYLEDWAVMWEV